MYITGAYVKGLITLEINSYVKYFILINDTHTHIFAHKVALTLSCNILFFSVPLVYYIMSNMCAYRILISASMLYK